tara:strand:+ start:7120 stop:7497 length:378 start_codon:yes stop_codon:yes gene_type:complete
VSKIDDVFGPIPGPLITKWGQAMTFVRVNGTGVYDQTTGVVTPNETNISVKAIITQVSPTEVDGVLQVSDAKILIDAAQLGTTYIKTSDKFIYQAEGSNVTASVVRVSTTRGDNPIFYTCFVRPQ